jgi:hypothetical protein
MNFYTQIVNIVYTVFDFQFNTLFNLDLKDIKFKTFFNNFKETHDIPFQDCENYFEKNINFKIYAFSIIWDYSLFFDSIQKKLHINSWLVILFLLINVIVVIVPVFLSVAFMTLLERKIMATIQRRR